MFASGGAARWTASELYRQPRCSPTSPFRHQAHQSGNEPTSTPSEMRYVMRQKLLSWGDDFYVKDEAGNDVYFVDGKALSFGDQLSFQDLERHELAFIKQRVFAWGKTYEIFRGGELAAVVKKELFALFHHAITTTASGINAVHGSPLTAHNSLF